MAPNKGKESLLDLCNRTIALGNSIAVHTLEYLSIAKTPRHGFRELAVEFLEASRALFPAKAGLARSTAKFSTDVQQELRERFSQTNNAFTIMDQVVNKLLGNEKKQGFAKLGKGFSMIFAENEIDKLRVCLQQCRAALSISALMFSSVIGEGGKLDVASGIGYTALAAILDIKDPTHGRSNSQNSQERALAALSPDRRPLPPAPILAPSPGVDMFAPRISSLREMPNPSFPDSSVLNTRPTQVYRSPTEDSQMSSVSHVFSDRSSIVGVPGDGASDITSIFSMLQEQNNNTMSFHAFVDKVPKEAIRVKHDPSKAPRWRPKHTTPNVSDASRKALTNAVQQKDHKTIEQLLDHGIPAENSLLGAAVINHDIESMRLLLLFGADVNAKDKDGSTPLYTATGSSFFEAAQLLMKYGADPNVSAGPYGENPFAVSLTPSKAHFAQLYLQHGADTNAMEENGCTPFTQSMNKSTPASLVELMMVYDADPNNKNIRGETPLFKAINAGRTDLVTLLLDHGADPNLPGPKIVLWAAVHTPQMLEILLERGADLRRAPGVLELATSINSREAIDLLLKHGADPNAKKDGIYTPLCSAIRDNREDLVDLLLANGADPNLTALEFPCFKCVTYHRSHLLPRLLAAGANPNSPKGIIEHAVAHNDKDALQFFLEHNVDPNARNKSGHTALTTAIKENRLEMIDLLLAHGADPGVRGHDWPISMAVRNAEVLVKLLPHIETSRINKGAVEMAVVANQLESVKLLLAKGVDVEEKNGGVFSPLTTSIRENRKDIFRYLIDEAGADPNAPGEHLPIIKAIRRHREDDMSYIEHLLFKGADINLMYRGWNAVLQAVDNGDVQILRLLAAKGNPDLRARDEHGRSVHDIMQERGLQEEESILSGGRSPSPKIKDAQYQLRELVL
ncbi:Putative ankyrin repeat protein [Fulvia fulva]|uniref:Ankyrin repeat protein n=1 Tax=Passalora fulva TaxID=5499 RepID=A0A9Q8UWL8_PASFU|nr:Putative ankyrin repeat protein [Fulvia fulva]KAK4609049.1 putative ankyrin repeat protein [Fulvia fulva]KAK4609732.1 putative ankyrin repeat protein [Fulvia fulva]UJO25151.1 Putative ankyrin repeat protein [Fulvia fulva]WPV22649.1 Putative ankyrin repeat protein [Fulvia fulva]WPV37428.1 Putative ankyrin repeat protein [Fulvia fulva]